MEVDVARPAGRPRHVNADAEPVDVGATVDRAVDLWRGEARGAADDVPAWRGGAERPGDAEVGQLDLALRRDEHVPRRDVAVHDLQRAATFVTLPVRVVE